MTELSWQDPLRGGAVAREGFRLAVAEELALARLQVPARANDAVDRAAASLARPLPPVGEETTVAGCRLAGRAPGEWLLLADGEDTAALVARLEAALAGQTVAITAATDGLVALRLSGARRRTVLARGTTLDVDLLAPGRCAVTRFAGVSALLLPEPEAMLLVVCRSLAVYLRDWCDAASVDCC